MRNLDAIINQLANEQQRTEHLLVEDLKAIKQEAQLFFDKQAREADAYVALLTTRFEDIINRIQNGYPKEQGFGELTEDPVPAFLTRPKIAPADQDSILKSLANAISPEQEKQ
jgi:hypothetical protein